MIGWIRVSGYKLEDDWGEELAASSSSALHGTNIG
jgi:hypothetical protein